MRGLIFVVLLLGTATVNAETPFYVGGGIGIMNYSDGDIVGTEPFPPFEEVSVDFGGEAWALVTKIESSSQRADQGENSNCSGST